jgi:hypothetical protein
MTNRQIAALVCLRVGHRFREKFWRLTVRMGENPTPRRFEGEMEKKNKANVVPRIYRRRGSGAFSYGDSARDTGWAGILSAEQHERTSGGPMTDEFMVIGSVGPLLLSFRGGPYHAAAQAWYEEEQANGTAEG